MSTKKCIECLIDKDINEFYKRNSRGWQGYCKKCWRDKNNSWYARNQGIKAKYNKSIFNARRSIMLKYKASLSCKDCGFSFSNEPWLVDFDHLSNDKSFNIATAIATNKNWCVIVKEIEKCDPVCPTCHRKRTAVRGKYAENFIDKEPIKKLPC